MRYAECGTIAAQAVPLIMHGSESVFPGQWPWVAALHRRHGDWELICGGTLITDNAVITGKSMQ